MFANIYSGRKVLVTGHTGFKGSWLSAWLIALGARVWGLSLPALPSSPSLFDSLRLHDKLEDLRGDIRNPDWVKECLDAAQPDVVFHLAAQPIVRESYKNPADTFTINATGTLNVLEAVRQCPQVKALVIITSDKAYRNDEWVWGYRETDHLGGADPYSASKGCAEFIAHSYFQSFFRDGPAGATARAGNVIGGGDWAADRIVPDCARSWAQGIQARIRSPHATRPWQHVLEPLSGYLWLGGRLLDNDLCGKALFSPAGQAYNFGPSADVAYPVADLVTAFSRFWPGFTFAMQDSADISQKECLLLKLCCDKALAHLDWRAVLNFEETVRYTAEWYARYYAGTGKEDMWSFTLGQISAYVNSALERQLLWART